MIGMAVRLWTCDGCEAQVSIDASTGPSGWFLATAVVIPETRTPKSPQYQQHWCPSCTEFAFNRPRVASAKGDE